MTDNNEAIAPENNVSNEALSQAADHADPSPDSNRSEADKSEADESNSDMSGTPIITAQNGQGSGAPSGSHNVPDSIVIAPYDSASIRQSIEALATGQARISSER